MSILKPLGIAWTVWKVTTKRFGPVGGFLIAALVLGGYLFMRNWLKQNQPHLAERIE